MKITSEVSNAARGSTEPGLKLVKNEPISLDHSLPTPALVDCLLLAALILLGSGPDL